MSDIIPNSILSCLNQQNYDVRDIPPNGRNDIIEQGFYYDSELHRVEHWSELCEYNYCMADHFSNAKGLINDGFLNAMAFDDIDHMLRHMKIWKDHLEVKLNQ